MATDVSLISHELNRTHDKIGTVEQFHQTECLDFVEQLGLASREKLSPIVTKGELPERRSKHLEGLARIVLAKMASLEGNSKFAAELFQAIFDHPGQLDRESARENGLAYLNYEFSMFLDQGGDNHGALLHLERAKSLARSNKLKHIVDYRIMELGVDSQKKSTHRDWLQSIAYFNKYGMKVMELQARYGLARHHFKAGENSEAAIQLEESHLQATEAGYNYLLGTIELMRAEILIKQDRSREALRFLISLEDRFKSSYLRARLLQNIALLQEAGGDSEAALQTAKEAVELSLRFGVLPIIAEASVLVGSIFHRSEADITKSFFYYQKAYGAVQELMGLGFPAHECVSTVIEKYISFLEEHFPGEVEEAANEDLFAFSKDMNWVRIKDLFHYNLFLYHYMNTGVGGRTLEVLDFPASSFYSATERLRSRGITFPNFRKSKVEIPSDNYVEGMQQYCRMHREKSWVEINERFEKDMLAYHYKLNNYNKKIMARKLELAYSGIVNRTQYLTSRK